MIYLDNASTTFPKPLPVYDAVNDCLRNYCANPGRGSHQLSLECELRILECRERLAKLLNIPNPLRIIFTTNTTEGLNIAIKGVLNPGDHVIASMIDHNSVLRPLEYTRTTGVEVTLLPVDAKGYINLAQLKDSIKKNTKAVIVNHGSNALGTIQDIKSIGKITRPLGLLLIVDGAQTVGYLDIDVQEMNIDILAFPGHKSLLGLQGTGGLYVCENVDLQPLKQGGTGSNSHSVVQPTFMPDRLESGTLNTPGIVGLSEGVNFILSEGLKSIRTHEINLMNELTEKLLNLPYINVYGEINPLKKTPVLSFNIADFDSSEVGRLLNDENICVRTGYHCVPMLHKIIGTERKGTIRVSPGYFNSSADIENLVISIKKIYTLLS